MNSNDLEKSFQPDFLLESIFGETPAPSGSKVFVSFIYLKNMGAEAGFTKVYSNYEKALDGAAKFFTDHTISDIISKQNIYPNRIDIKTGQKRCEVDIIKEIKEIFPTYIYDKNTPSNIFNDYYEYIRSSGKKYEELITEHISLLKNYSSPIYFYITTKYIDSEGDTFPQRLIDYSVEAFND